MWVAVKTPGVYLAAPDGVAAMTLLHTIVGRLFLFSIVYLPLLWSVLGANRLASQ